MRLQARLPEPIKDRLRRTRLIVQLYRARQTPAAKGRLRLGKESLAAAKRLNRESLKAVPNWIDRASLEMSVCEYGTSLGTRENLNNEIGDETTYSDLMASFCNTMTTAPNYLEIGVSVGKNFWQLINSVPAGTFWGLDIENINPILAGKFSFTSKREITSSFKSGRSEVPHVSFFSHDGKAIAYSAGDVFDDAVWDAFNGQQFSLIFSDASHTPEAILSEWKQISNRSLLDQNGFTVIWDDLGSRGMREAFNEIVVDCGVRYGISSQNACLTHVHGWVGSAEPFHPIGIISNHGFVA